MIMSSIFSRLTILVFGSLYPAYASFKTVRARNVQHYVQWMMYWIVFAIFTCIEIFADIFLFWIPFYYEIKVLFVFWLLSPATNGSSILYRNFVHPLLKRKENKIDDCITQMKQQSCATIMSFGSNGLHQLSAFILEMVHFNFRSVLQQPATRVQSTHLLPDGITTTSREESELKAKEFNIPQLDIEKVEIHSNAIGKTTKKTGKEKCAKNPHAEDNRSIARGRGRRTKTIIVEEAI